MDSTLKWLKRNTSIGPNLTSLRVMAWFSASSLKSIKNLFAFFGLKVCKRTVESMLTSASGSMNIHCGRINRALRNTIAKFGETPITIYDRRGYVWVCVGDNAASVHVSHSRSAVVPEQHYSCCLGRQVTTDGFAGYNSFEPRQCCWSHILRDAEYSADRPETVMLHKKLKMLFHDAKQMRPDDSLDGIVLKTRCIAEQYADLGVKFGTTLNNAADQLYTFVKHPRMHPTNNESERMLRKVVIHRKIHQMPVAEGGMRMFEIIMTCMLTWGRRKLNLGEKLLEVMWAT